MPENAPQTTMTPARSSDEFVNQYLMANGRYFRERDLAELQDMLSQATPMQREALVLKSFKSPVLLLVLSLFFGGFGVDRFLVGDILLGVLKLLTLGGLGIWTLIDWFLIMGRTKDLNKQLLASELAG